MAGREDFGFPPCHSFGGRHETYSRAPLYLVSARRVFGLPWVSTAMILRLTGNVKTGWDGNPHRVHRHVLDGVK